MSFQEEIFDKIEAYLSGELDAEEVRTFENQISADDVLKQQIEKHKIANALIVEQRLLSVKNILQEEKIKDSNASSSNKPFGLIVLAVATVGIGASLLFLNQKEDETVSIKQENLTTQTASETRTSDSKQTYSSTSKSKDEKPVVKDVVQSEHASSENDNGFHKHQIQQVEEQATDQGDVSIDSLSSNVKKQQPITFPQTTNATAATKPAIVASPCANVLIQATVKVTPSCSDRASGGILIQDIKGGTKPYVISLSSISNESIVNGEIPKGTYQAMITDANGCIRNYSTISITEKECPRDYSFNPFYGDEEWYIGPEVSAGQLEIYDKAGVLYFQKNIPANMSYKWSGMGIGNQTLPGYYIFVIKYDNGTVKRGSVTIVQ